MTGFEGLPGGAWGVSGAMERIAQADAIVFDCDGVLIDVRQSYDEAIRQTASFVLAKYAGLPDAMPVSPEIIEAFKATGGFNDEVDLAYAASLCIAAACSRNAGAEFVLDVASRADRSGIRSVEALLGQSDAASQLRAKLDYGGRHASNTTYDIFDQVFYGPERYEKMFGKKSAFAGPGLVERDLVLIDEGILSSLEARFGKMIAMVTGRGREAAQMGLGGLLGHFDLEHSAFLEDEPREMAKPNPEPLIRCMKGMGSGRAIYVGDSAEDLMMAQAASGSGRQVTFCAITGTSERPEQRRALFEGRGADMAAESVSVLANTLNQA